MTKRTVWEFPYTADKLLKAATNKRDYHLGRFAWWKKKQADVMAQIKSGGIEIEQSLLLDDTADSAEEIAAKWSNSMSNSAYRGPAVSIRNDLLNDLNETIQKMREHREKTKDYGAWVDVLASQGQTALPLDQQDWLFFFGDVKPDAAVGNDAN